MRPDAKPVEIGVARGRGPGGRAGENPHFRPDPPVRRGLEHFADRHEGAAVPAVAEAAARRRVDGDPQVDPAGRRGEARQLLFRLAPVRPPIDDVGEAQAPGRAEQAEQRVIVAEDRQRRALAHGGRREFERGGRGELRARELLEEEIRGVVDVVPRRPAVVAPRRRRHAGEPQPARPRRQRAPARPGIGVPLPLRAQRGTVEFVRSLGHRDRPAAADVRLRMDQRRLPPAVGVRMDADRGPVVRPPDHRLQVDHAAEGPAVLEMQEPILPRRGVDPGALMGAVDRGPAAGEDDAVFVGAGEVAGAKHGLIAARDPAGWREDVVIAVALVEFRALERGPVRDPVAVDDRDAGVRHRGAVRGQLVEGEQIRDSRAALRPGVDEIELAIVVPERAGVDEPPARLDQPRQATRRRPDRRRSSDRARGRGPDR